MHRNPGNQQIFKPENPALCTAQNRV